MLSKVKQSFESWNDDNFLEIIKGNKICANLELDEIEYSQILVNKNNIDNVSVDIECEKLMEAPVYENTKVGTITIKLGEDVVSKSNILVKETVNKKTILEYFYEIMQNFKIL